MDEVETNNKASEAPKGAVENSSKKSTVRSKSAYSVVSEFLTIPLLLMLLWQWDGFWQTQVQPLKVFQKQYFPEKYRTEQLKLLNIRNNIETISEFQQENNKLATQLKQARVGENKYHSSCRYLDSAMRMMDNLKVHLSRSELDESLRCTNRECEEIKSSSIEPFSICSDI